MTRDADPSAPPLSPLRDGLARGQYAAARAAAGIVRAMPLDVASATMGAAWRAIAPWTHRHPRALGHVALAMPELDEAERRRIVMGMWDNLGRVTAETLQIDRLIADPSRIELPARTIEILEQARQGGVLVSLHTGNWEVVVRAATAAGLIATGIYRSVDNPYVERWLYGMRRPLYPGGLIPKGDPAARQLITRVNAPRDHRRDGRPARFARSLRGAVLRAHGLRQPVPGDGGADDRQAGDRASR